MTAPAYIRDPAEITRRSFQIIAAEADLASLPEDIQPVAARIIHACGMTDVVADLAYSPAAGAHGRASIAAGAPILCDVRMVPAGLTGSREPGRNPVLVALDSPGRRSLPLRPARHAPPPGLSFWPTALRGLSW
jgi:precorrin-8X/cobalt-precorrin-8 methylmutase